MTQLPVLCHKEHPVAAVTLLLHLWHWLRKVDASESAAAVAVVVVLVLVLRQLLLRLVVRCVALCTSSASSNSLPLLQHHT